ncbi:hypothetical protein [Campylobacter concisus]|uniref:hypothetical protein n=1 Tax=Campylobacter concisus TaxID=199 RepID=UPI0015E19599|nr:hypothetical protein [Campylobacter concisus]
MAQAACNDKFQDQARWMSGVVLEFVMFEPNLTFWRIFFLFRQGEILVLSEG